MSQHENRKPVELHRHTLYPGAGNRQENADGAREGDALDLEQVHRGNREQNVAGEVDKDDPEGGVEFGEVGRLY